MLECDHVDHDIQDRRGYTVLHYAVSGNQIEVIRYLFDYTNAHPHKQYSNVSTALYRIFDVMNQDHDYNIKKECVKLLLTHCNINTNIKYNGYTVEDLARNLRWNDIADMIANYEPTISPMDNK